MPVHRYSFIKLFLLFLIAPALFLSFPRVIFAQVLINEFSSNSDPEWVEIYNESDQTIDLSGWRIVDNNQIETDDIELSGCIVARGFRSFSRSAGWLNNTGGDAITLKNSSAGQINQVIYGSGGIVGIPPDGKSAGRNPDGSLTWQIFDSPSQTNNSCQLASTPTATFTPIPTPTPTLLISTPTSTLTPTPTPTPKPTLTPTLQSTNTPVPTPTTTPLAPTPTLRPTLTLAPTLTLVLTPTPKAKYQINEVKNEGGDSLSNVKIYVDNVYLHHYAPETISFCEGCKCDSIIDCGFGEHTIKLEKTGYANWIETKMIAVGGSYEVNPVMSVFVLPSLEPTVTLLMTSTPRATPTVFLPTSQPASPSSGLVIDQTDESGNIAYYPLAHGSPIASPGGILGAKTSKTPLLLLPIIGFGGLFMTAFWVWYTRLR